MLFFLLATALDHVQRSDRHIQVTSGNVLCWDGGERAAARCCGEGQQENPCGFGEDVLTREESCALGTAMIDPFAGLAAPLLKFPQRPSLGRAREHGWHELQ